MSKPSSVEKREVRDVVSSVELRAAPEGSKSPGTMIGYAAVFGKTSCDLGMFRERIAPGAFRAALAKCDVRALVNHDPNCLLGRSSAGTLRMAEDEIGLRVEIDLPDTSTGRDTAENIRVGNIQGQSFSFTTARDEWDFKTDPVQRTVNEVDQLYDVGPVTFPAYEETSVAMRSYRSSQAPPPPTPPDHSLEHHRDSARLRLLEVS